LEGICDLRRKSVRFAKKPLAGEVAVGFPVFVL